MITKCYVDSSLGQIHVRKQDATDNKGTPLVCLHPAPISGLYFTTAMPLLASGRDVYAPDYPGYGGSQQQEQAPSIQDYAESMLQVMDGLGITEPCDILGFHTGCLVGAEMALLAGHRFRNIVLLDVPYFSAEVCSDLRKKMAQPMAISSELQSLEAPWTFNVSSRIRDVPLPRTIELFAEHMRGGRNDYFAFEAAFTYPCEERFAEIQQSVSVVATQSGLLEPSRAAAKALPRAHLTEALDIKGAVFESGAGATSATILDILDHANE